ncbi:MAG: glycoside hydrolase family 3 C-terminal domain-containing protein [Oscillospiraceae bacterium]|nr:glycoside hydrolase family 3 C-terminal domain-containing protein [Oscillospiraceae bacterium]
MSNPKKKGSGIKLWSVMTVVLVILLVASIIGTNIALSAAQAINIFLKTSTYKVVDNGDGSDSIYYESEYSSREELEAAGKSIAEQVEAEGAVLLINNGALPLASGSKVSTVSHSSIDIVTCGNGAADIDTSDAPSLKEALEEVGYVVNPTLWDFYATGAGSAYIREPGKLSNQTEGASRDQYIINEVPQSVYTADVKSSFAEYADAAIVTISRISGEGADLANNGFRDGTNILELTDNEKDMMQMAQDNFETVIVLINSTNAVDCSFLYDYEVDAALWIGYTGEWGLNAVADILVGNVNPSGHLVDTYTFDNNSAPAVVGLYGGNFSNYSAEDTRFYDVYGAQLDGNHTYITYLEGIYVGYRYYETRYEDVVMGTGNAGDYDYASTVAFPFGYGLSYTTFEWSNYQCQYNKRTDSFTITVDVTNTGDVPGKEVVQVYFQSPYTDYDKQNGIEKASVELCGFGKTAILEPGKSETVTIEVPREELACYDSNGAKTYILDAGDYYLTAANNAHAAVNNVLAAKGYTTANGMTEEGNADLTSTYTVDELDTETYSVSSVTGNEITNQFSSADLSQYGYDVTYLSRSDWQGTWPEAMTLEATDKMFEDGLYMYQTYTGIEGSTTEMPTMGAQNGLNLAMYIGVDYDDPAWEDLLDQLTFEEMAVMISQGYHNTAAAPSVGKPATIDDNGPQGFTQNLTGVAESITAYTDENIMAATFNVDLMEEMGECLGEDCMELGASGLYGPAMNIHRNAYAGRNFEYYSEDPFLSGKIAAAEIKGIQSKGVYVYIKHFAINDNETGCRCIATWANEQSIREIYLEPFQIAVEEGDAHAVMNAFARFGVVWSGAHEGLMTEVLRNEWGFDGFGLTDFSGNAVFAQYGIMMKSFDVAHGLLAGTDSWDSSAVQWTDDLNNLYKNDPDICQAMRQASHRILYTVANSNAMNGISSNSTIVSVTPWWQIALYTLCGVMAAGTLLCAVKLVLSIKKSKAAKQA